jgi:DNA-binding NtrC family response regulator
MKRGDSVEQLLPPYVLVVFPSDEYRASLLSAVADTGMLPLSCRSLEEAQEAMKGESVLIVVCEDLLPEMALKSILRLARNRTEPIPVIVTSRTGGWEEFLQALRLGVFDYLVLPPRRDEVSRVLGHALAEATRTEESGNSTSILPTSEGKQFVYSSDDRWDIRFADTAPVLSRPPIPCVQGEETK